MQAPVSDKHHDDTSKQQAKTEQPQPALPTTKRRENPTIIAPHRELTVAAVKAEEARLQALAKLKEHPYPEGDLTDQLENAPLDVLALLRSLASRIVPDRTVIEYRALPYRSPSPSLHAGPVWRIELHGSKLGPEPVGIDVSGDVVIGRGPDCDLDMDAHNGYESGISRRHAMLRPSNRHLYLIDLGSTNGTFYNMVPLATNATHPLKHDDLITLGQFNMTLKMIKQPDPDTPSHAIKRPDSLPRV